MIIPADVNQFNLIRIIIKTNVVNSTRNVLLYPILIQIQHHTFNLHLDIKQILLGIVHNILKSLIEDSVAVMN